METEHFNLFDGTTSSPVVVLGTIDPSASPQTQPISPRSLLPFKGRHGSATSFTLHAHTPCTHGFAPNRANSAVEETTPAE